MKKMKKLFLTLFALAVLPLAAQAGGRPVTTGVRGQSFRAVRHFNHFHQARFFAPSYSYDFQAPVIVQSAPVCQQQLQYSAAPAYASGCVTTSFAPAYAGIGYGYGASQAFFHQRQFFHRGSFNGRRGR